MKKTPLSAVKPGMELARPVYGIKGEILLNVGTKLKPKYIRNLLLMGVGSVYIKDERLADVKQDELINEKTKQEAHLLIKNMFTETSEGGENFKNIVKLEEEITTVTNKLFEDILSNDELILNLVDIKATNNYFFEHSLSVAVLSIIIALKMNIPVSRVKRNAAGLLLFDIGNTKIPKNILSKKGSLNKKEFEDIKKHPLHGHQLFKKNKIFSDSSGLIVAQHHERLNGKGYPRGLEGKKINLLAQIVSVADVYDALISDRPYRKAFYPFEALELLSGMGEAGLNVDIIRVLFNFVAAFPVGLHVMLSNGESGLVVDNTPGHPLRPKVRIFYEGNRLTPLSDPYEIDLTEKLDIVVEKVLTDDKAIEVTVNSFPFVD